jgi:hypothetical protein
MRAVHPALTTPSLALTALLAAAIAPAALADPPPAGARAAGTAWDGAAWADTAHVAAPWGDPLWSDWRRGSTPPLGLSTAVAGRFGVQVMRDPVSGERRVEPLAQLGVRLTWYHETDNGLGFAVSVGISGDTLRREPAGPWR